MDSNNIEFFKPNSIVNSSFSVVLAKRRGGKSTLISDIAKKLFIAEKIDCCLLFSGTNSDDFPQIKKDYRFDDISKLNEIIENYKILNEYNKIADPPNRFKIKTMIILDDLLLKLKTKDFSIIQELSVNGRHVSYHPLSLHIVILAQNLMSIPRLVRNNLDYLITNQLSGRELELVLDEYFFIIDSSREGKKIARKLYQDLVSSQDFLFIVIENHRQNVRSFPEYLKKYVADYKK